MKILIALIAALVAGNSYAILVPLSAERSVSIDGIASSVAGSESYSQSESSSGLGAFVRDLSGSAESLGFAAQSRAAQTSTISPTEILIDTLLRATTQMPFSQPPGFVTASASSLFEVTFQNLEPLSYELSGSFYRFDDDLLGSSFNLSLLGSLGAIFADQTVLPRTGTLLPDTYTFRIASEVGALIDPLGDLAFSESRVSLRTTSVSDGGSTLLLLGGAFGLLLIGRKTFLDASDSL